MRTASTRDTFGRYFLEAYDRHPDGAVVHWSGGTFSYGSVLLRAAAIVERFLELGIRPGDFVACYIEEQLPCLVFDLACALTGVIPVPLSPVYSTDYLVNGVVKKVNAKAVLTTPGCIEEVCAAGIRPMVLAGEPGLAYGFLPADVSSVDVDVEVLSPNCSLNESRARELLENTSHGIGCDDIFMIQPTSGSTGTPKLVLRRHCAFARYAKFVGRELEKGQTPNEPHRFLMASTLTHAFGLHILTTALRMQASVSIPLKLDAATDLEEVRQLDPTVLPLLPRVQRSFYRQWLDRSERPFGPSAQFVCSAGGLADPEILGAFKKHDLDIIVFYGSTEASVIAVTPSKGWLPRHAGKPVDDVEIKLAKTGEVLVRSSGLTPGYYKDPEMTGSVFTEDGFYRTGDVGEFSDDGYLRIVGRARDVFNTAEGSNIYPRRIEQMIETQDWAEQAIMFGDGRPYLVALIALSSSHAEGRPPGFISDEDLPMRYEMVRKELQKLNENLERVEKVVRFLLFSAPLDPRSYRIVGPGKVRREREAASQIYAQEIEGLYSNPSPYGWLTVVPGTDRRLRPRKDSVATAAGLLARARCINGSDL